MSEIGGRAMPLWQRLTRRLVGTVLVMVVSPSGDEVDGGKAVAGLRRCAEPRE